MVKRAVAIVLGALAGVLLWHAAQWVRAQAHEADGNSGETCAPDVLVDCVSHEAPAPGEPAPRSCKDWLAGNGAGASVLSDCLQAARRTRDEEFERVRNIAGSS